MTVRFGDLDPYNHVNHARYLTYFESARIELLEEIGFGMGVLEDLGVQIVLVEVSATARWRQEAHRSEELIASADVRAAFTDLAGRPTRPPAGFAGALVLGENDPG